MNRRIKTAMLVYQAGIANVFSVRCANLSPFRRDARCLLQGSFRECEAFARGLGAAGVIVHSAGCNQAGNVAEAKWTDGLGALPFADRMEPVECTRGLCP